MPYNISKDEWKRWAIESHNVSLKSNIVKASSLEEKNDDMRETDQLTEILGGMTIAAGIIAAPFTGGASLVPTITAFAATHLKES